SRRNRADSARPVPLRADPLGFPCRSGFRQCLERRDRRRLLVVLSRRSQKKGKRRQEEERHSVFSFCWDLGFLVSCETGSLKKAGLQTRERVTGGLCKTG